MHRYINFEPTNADAVQLSPGSPAAWICCQRNTLPGDGAEPHQCVIQTCSCLEEQLISRVTDAGFRICLSSNNKCPQNITIPIVRSFMKSKNEFFLNDIHKYLPANSIDIEWFWTTWKIMCVIDAWSFFNEAHRAGPKF